MDDITSSAEDYSSISIPMSFQDPNSTLLQAPENSQFLNVELNSASSSNPFDSQFLLPASSGSSQVIIPSYVTEVDAAEDQSETIQHGRSSFIDIPLIGYDTKTRCNTNVRTPRPTIGTSLLSNGVQTEPLNFHSLVVSTSIQNTNSLPSTAGLHLVSSSSSQNSLLSNNIAVSEETNGSVVNVISPISKRLASSKSTTTRAEFLHPSLRNVITRSLSSSTVGLIDLNNPEINGHQQYGQQSATDLFQKVSTEPYLQCNTSQLEKQANSDMFSTNCSSWNAAASSAGTKMCKLRDGAVHQPKTYFHGSASVVSMTNSKPHQISILNSNSSHPKFSLNNSGSLQAFQHIGLVEHNPPSLLVAPTTSKNPFCGSGFVIQEAGMSADYSEPDAVTKISAIESKFIHKEKVTSQDSTQNIFCQLMELPDIVSPLPMTPHAEDLFSNFNSKKHTNDNPQMQMFEEIVSTCKSNALESVGASSFRISDLTFSPNQSSSHDVNCNSGDNLHTEFFYNFPTSNIEADNTIKILLPSQYVHQNAFTISNSNIDVATAEPINQFTAVQANKVVKSTALVRQNFNNMNAINGNKNKCAGSYPASSTSSATALEENSRVGKPLPLEHCLYEIVRMLKCSTCSELFQDAAALVLHYQKVHCSANQISPVKITVRTSNATKENDKPIVVCQHCGTAVPPAVLDWYTISVRGKPSGRKRKSLTLFQEPKRIQHNKSLSGSPLASCRGEGCVEEGSVLYKERDGEDAPAEHCDSDDGMQIYVLGGVTAAKQVKSIAGECGSPLSSPPRKRRSLRPPARLQLYDLPGRPPVATPPAPKRLRCRKPACKLLLSTEENRDLHEQCHLPPGEDPRKAFTCPLCHLPSHKWQLTQRHLWRVHKRDVDMLVCGICYIYRAHNAYTLRVHQETHSADRGYTCKECGLQFRQLSQLLGHTKTHSAAGPLSQCKVCHRMFANTRLLSKHVKTVHENLRPHSCSHCNYRTDRTTDLRKHLRTHSKEAPLCCPVCSRRFSDQSSYRRHLLRHLPQPLLHCPRCLFATSLPFHFARHCATHQEQDGQSFNCKVCGTKWSTVAEYTGHSRTHHSDMIAQLLVQHPEPEESEPDG